MMMMIMSRPISLLVFQVLFYARIIIADDAGTSSLLLRSELRKQQQEQFIKEEEEKLRKEREQKQQLKTKGVNPILPSLESTMNDIEQSSSSSSSLQTKEWINMLLTTYQGGDGESSSLPTHHDSNNNTVTIHIGPQKTGSTTIQQFMVQRRIRETLLEQDRYARVPEADFQLFDKNLASCFDKFDTLNAHLHPCHPETLAKIIQLAKQNVNLIVTTESMSQKALNVSKLHHFFSMYYSNIYVVLYYRRFFTWIVSLHNQHEKIYDSQARSTLVEWLQDHKGLLTKYHGFYFTGVMHRLQEYFQPHQIRHYHINHDLQDSTLMEQFFCDAIPDSPSTCELTRDIIRKEGVPSNYNGGVEFAYIDLAYYANEMNLLSSDIIEMKDWNNKVATAAKYHQYNTLQIHNSYDFGNMDNETLICPTQDTYQLLWNLTINSEHEFFPQYNNDQLNHETHVEFQYYVDTYKFCHVNAPVVLSNNYHKWRDYFTRLTVDAVQNPKLYRIEI